jgi:HEAT repeat protein
MAQRLTEASPERALKIVELFVRELERADSKDDVRQFLLVLGNAGAAQALSAITRFTIHPSPRLRAIAVSALRRIDSLQADEALIKALTSDSDVEVRQAAIFALSARDSLAYTFAAQRKAMLKDSAPKVRAAAMRNLWRERERFPQVFKLVKQLAARDTSADVRKAATALLASHAAPAISGNLQTPGRQAKISLTKRERRHSL